MVTDKFTNESGTIVWTGNGFQITNGYLDYCDTLDEFRSDEPAYKLEAAQIKLNQHEIRAQTR